MEPQLIDTGRGFTIKYKGRHLYSSVDPLSSALDQVRAASIPPLTLIFVPSLGLGYGLRELLDKLPVDSHVLCVEADQRLMGLALGAGASLLPRDPRLTVIRTEDPVAAVRSVQAIGLGSFRRVQPLYLCGGHRLYPDVYRRMLWALEEEIRLFWQNKLTLIHMSRLWLANLFTNLVCLDRDLSCLATDKPVLVAAAGPSLEESLGLIRAARAELLLLAADTALPTLVEAGLAPDWICCLDAQLANLQDFIPYRPTKSALLCDLTAPPQLVRLFRGRAYFFSSRFHPLKLFERLERAGLLPTPFPPLGCVGVAAVHAALGLTSGPVIVTGLDFSYSGGRTHARGTAADRAMHAASSRFLPPGSLMFQAIQERPLLRLKGKEGTRVLSDLVLQSYSLQLQSQASCGRVYDLGRRGLLTGGRPLASESELLSLLQAPAGAARSKPAPRPGIRAEAAEGFLTAETQLLGRCAELLRSRLAEAEMDPVSLPQELAECLEALDYLTLHLPADPWGGSSSGRRTAGRSFLVEALRLCLAYQERLRRLRPMLGPGHPMLGPERALPQGRGTPCWGQGAP